MLIELLHVSIIAACLAISVFYGRYMAKVFQGERNLLSPIMRPVERGIYWICGIDETKEMTWKAYLGWYFVFEILCFPFAIAVLMFQGSLPLNPHGVSSFSFDEAFNAATSFITNTEWQVYSGERDFSYLSQILALIVQDFWSPSVGIVCAIALFRGFARKNFSTIGNFWVDITRSVFYIILPIAVVFAFFLASQGVIANLSPYVTTHGLDGADQLIPGGPAAAVTALQIICEDGGGFFNVNAVHPFATPTPLSYWLEMGIMLLVPSSLIFAFGEIIRNRKIGLAIFLAMLALYILSSPFYLVSEFQGNPILEKLGVQGGVNMEGKDQRFTVFEVMIWTLTSMCPANGSTLSQHDSLLPISIMGILWNIVVGAPIFGCWGTGAITIIYYFIIAMFLGGLMTGRTPEMAGKKIEPFETILGAASLLLSSLPTSDIHGNCDCITGGPCRPEQLRSARLHGDLLQLCSRCRQQRLAHGWPYHKHAILQLYSCYRHDCWKVLHGYHSPGHSRISGQQEDDPDNFRISARSQSVLYSDGYWHCYHRKRPPVLPVHDARSDS